MRPDRSIRSPRGDRWSISVAAALVLLLSAPCVLAQCQTNQNCYPPAGGCAYPASTTVFYPGAPGPTGIRNGYLHDPNACTALPGGSQVNSFFDVFFEVDLTTDGGQNWTHYNLPLCPGVVRISPPSVVPPDRHFNTELLSLSLSGGGLPAMIRESPTLPSNGGIDQRDLGGGLYRLDSFFDVFTELSLDGGQSWFPTSDQLHITTIDLTPTATHAATWGAMKILYR